MKLARIVPLALTLSLAAGSLGAQAKADPDIAAAQGKDPMPAGWTMRLDRAGASKATLRFVKEGAGMRVTSGPAAIYWDPRTTVTGPFTAEVTFTQLKKPAHPEAYGIFWGGENLEADSQEYYYLVIRGDGKYTLKHRAGPETHELAAWTDHAGVAKEDGAGKAKTTLKIESTAAGLKLFANGQLIKELPADPSNNGIVGIRVNHNLDVQVDGLSVKKP